MPVQGRVFIANMELLAKLLSASAVAIPTATIMCLLNYYPNVLLEADELVVGAILWALLVGALCTAYLLGMAVCEMIVKVVQFQTRSDAQVIDKKGAK